MRYAVILIAVLWSFGVSAFAGKCEVNEQGVELVKHYEGFFPKAYLDGGSGRWAVGYGSQAAEYKIGPNTVWTEKHADKVLRKELNVVAQILCAQIIAPITDNQLSALTSLAYNIGPYAIIKSKLFSDINRFEPKEASKRFLRYSRSKGVILRGLKFRRKLEQSLFLTPDFVDLDIKATADKIFKGQ